MFGAYPFSPQFIRPTVPRPVNIDDFACFIRPNVRPKPSQDDPSHPSQGDQMAIFDQCYAAGM